MTLNNSNILIFKVGPVPCCVDSNNVQVVIEPPEHISAIPGSNTFRPGLFSYREKAVAVYDVRTKFNLPTEQRGKLLITELNNRLSGFWIDNIEEIITSDQGSWRPLPIDCPKELFDAVFLYKDQLIFKTNFDALVEAQVNTQVQDFIQTLVEKEQKEIEQTTTKAQSQGTIKTRSEIKEALPIAEHKKPVEKVKPESIVKHKTVTPVISDIANKKSKTHASIQHTIKEKHISAQKEKPEYTKPDKVISDKKISANTNKTIKTDTKTSHAKTIESSNYNQVIPERKVSKEKNTPEHRKTYSHPDSSASKQPETRNGSAGALIFLTLILAMSGAAYYYYTSINNTPTPIRVKHSTVQNKTKIFETPNTVEIITPTTLMNTTSTEVIDETGTDDYISNKKESAEEPVVDKAPEINHTASITHNKNEIVITIEDPDAKFNNSIIDENVTKPKITTETSDISSLLTANEIIPKPVNSNLEKPSNSQQQHQIIHIVVKGDTLWHIAKRYIHDPFKYKQLAKLSKIKNPDLIYPGNRIIIIIKNNKG